VQDSHFKGRSVLTARAVRGQLGRPSFPSATYENWQSAGLQLILQAVVLLGLKHQLFAADAEDMEVVHQDLIEIRQALDCRPIAAGSTTSPSLRRMAAGETDLAQIELRRASPLPGVARRFSAAHWRAGARDWVLQMHP